MKKLKKYIINNLDCWQRENFFSLFVLEAEKGIQLKGYLGKWKQFCMKHYCSCFSILFVSKTNWNCISLPVWRCLSPKHVICYQAWLRIIFSYSLFYAPQRNEIIPGRNSVTKMVWNSQWKTSMNLITWSQCCNFKRMST